MESPNKILITGATGNTGTEVIRALRMLNKKIAIRAGVRQPEKDRDRLAKADCEAVPFDFEDKATFRPALSGCQSIFLLRPPHITDIPNVFRPLLQEAVTAGIQHVFFLSVQGADKNRFIPHHKIENEVRKSGLAYTFLRPAYFMQNFTTTLLPDIKEKSLIYLPAGKARFTLVDVRDVGSVAAKVLLDPIAYRNKPFDLTSADLLDFKEMTSLITEITGKHTRYISPNPFSFFLQKRKEGVPAAFILVMIMLHYLPRFQKLPVRTNCIEAITGNKPISFAQFIADYKSLFVRL